MKKATLLLALLVIYLVSLIGLNFLHFRYLPVEVILYAALADVLIAIGITAIAVAAIGRVWTGGLPPGVVSRLFTRTEIVLAVVCAILIGYIWAISVPTVIDRSLSIYILEKLDQRGGAISLEAMRDIVIKEFIPEHRLIDARMTEQLSSGTLTIESGCVRLTSRGKTLAGLTRYYRTHLLPRNRLLMGTVSDDLTDPFRHSTPIVDYRCRDGR
jgi:hypothetical protein